MQSFISEFILALAGATAISFLYDSLMVSGKLKKYCAIAISLIAAVLILMPVIKLFSNDDFFDFKEIVSISPQYEKIKINEYKDFLEQVYNRSN